MENQDQFMSGEITNHLFEEKGIRFSGLDLAALNIQRGRDHGLRPYNEYRVACNLKKAKDFDDLSNEISPDVIKRLRQVYNNVDDVDFFTGGLSETPLQGALVGPTFACVIGIQFQKLKRCDRFWYENSGSGTRFSEAQLTEIRKITLSKIICENCDIVGDIQRSIFDQPHEFLYVSISQVFFKFDDFLFSQKSESTLPFTTLSGFESLARRSHTVSR